MGQKVADNKEAVEKTATEFDATAKQAVETVNAAGQTQIGQVNNAGSAQVQAVNAAAEAQVQAVENEGTAQVANVQAATAEIEADREQIAENAALLAALGLSVVNGELNITFEEE